ncbi:MAG: site-specific integrase [Bacteroides oleiciplenus]|mgnify:CR=1 FL=1|nr:site-specific integrase [Bacteroides oleiciplenus]
MKEELKIKEPIRIRVKDLTNGSKSIYLDMYMNGKRKYEFLRLYIIPENSKSDRVRNSETLKLANAIKAQRIIELQNQSYGFKVNKVSNIKLIDYLQSIAERKSENEVRKTALHAVICHLKRYDPNEIQLNRVDKEYILGFLNYLTTVKQTHSKKEKLLHVNTQNYYYKILRYSLNYAISEELISVNPMDKIKNEEKPHRHRTEREFLTIDELKKLAQTPFYNTLLKKAFLFSCFCGLRHSDIIALTWRDIEVDENKNYRLHIIQKKTKEAISLPLSQEGVKQLPKRENAKDSDKIFKGLITLGRTNEILPRWAEQAGIKKHITFHTARHTHATMLLTLGVDLYTVSKLLGHTNILTTQIYAKLVDESKKKAIDLIPNIT